MAFETEHGESPWLNLPADLPPGDYLQTDPSADDPTSTSNDPDTSLEAFEALIADDDAVEVVVESAGVPPVMWARDTDQPDYAHSLVAAAVGLAPPSRFEFSWAVFDLLIRANRFQPKGKNNLVAFGLRGGLLNGADTQESVDSVTIDDTRPDHNNFNCTLGIFDMDSRKMHAYSGSTVPNTKWMGNYYKLQNGIPTSKSIRCNLLPTGCYIYRVANHRDIEPALRMSDPDNLSADAVCTVLRTSNDLTYTHADLWDRSTPVDNIHCAYSNNSFSSAGCQTIKGPNGQGPWGAFQRVIGGLGKGARIDYVLLTARDAAIAAAIRDSGRGSDAALVEACLGRLRVGSEGEMVTALQKKLGFNGTAYFGPSTKKRMTEAEAAAGLASDGVYAPADDLALGWRVFGEPVESPGAPALDAATPTLSLTETPTGDGDWQATDDALHLHLAGGSGRLSSGADTMLNVGGTAIPLRIDLSLSNLPAAASGIAIVAEIRAVRTSAPPSATTPTPSHSSTVTATRLSAAIIDEFAPNALPGYRDALISDGASILGRFGIDATPRRLAHFLAQISHESGGLRLQTESLNYTSAGRLMEVWPSRFPTSAHAEPFVRNESALAEEVYGGRLGNSQPGDGFRFRGRGLIQITGRANYADYSERLGIDLLADPDRAFEPRIALAIAAEFWNSRKLRGERPMNALADDGKLRAITYRINGGFTSFEHREAELVRARRLLGNIGPVLTPPGILDRGDANDDVRRLQLLLVENGFLTGIVDGMFGFGTYKALVSFKTRLQLDDVGRADASTIDALRTFDVPFSEAVEDTHEVFVIGDEPEPVRNGVSRMPESSLTS